MVKRKATQKEKMAKKKARKKVARKKVSPIISIVKSFERLMARVKKQNPATRKHLRTMMMKGIRGVHRPTEKERTEKKHLRQLNRQIAKLKKAMS